ncbi:citrate lyase beta subunit [Agrobacterium vitis]|nr:citrate lyase beta subunit [Agrobacterium vitis]MBE1437608.1 citrate lyase beta subunit [Agrobacterium vitis]
MSINHSETGQRPSFSIGTPECRSLLWLDNGEHGSLTAQTCQPDAVVFCGENLAERLAQWQQGRHGALPFLLCISASLSHDAFANELTRLMALRPAGLMLTEAKSRADGERLDALLRVEEAKAGLRDGEMVFLAMLGAEPAGFARAIELAHSSSRLIAIGQDSRAIVSAIGARSLTAAAPVLNTTRSHVQLAAASAGLPAFEVLAGKSHQRAAQAKQLVNQGFQMLVTDDPDGLSTIQAAFEDESDL